MLFDLNPRPIAAKINVTPAGWYRDDEGRAWRIGAITDALSRVTGVVRVEADELAMVVEVPIEPGADLGALRAKLRRAAEDAHALWLAERVFIDGVRAALGEGTDAQRLERLRGLLDRPGGVVAGP